MERGPQNQSNNVSPEEGKSKKKSIAGMVGIGLVAAAAGFLGGQSGKVNEQTSLEDLEKRLEQVEKNKAERKVIQEKQEMQGMHKQLEVINKHLDGLKAEYIKKMGSESVEFHLFYGNGIVEDRFYIFDKVSPNQSRKSSTTTFVLETGEKGESITDRFKKITVNDIIEAVKNN